LISANSAAHAKLPAGLEHEIRLVVFTFADRGDTFPPRPVVNVVHFVKRASTVFCHIHFHFSS
jgi:hypothetical protein